MREPRSGRRLLFVLAHPDDESMGSGATIARHVCAGVEVHLVCATRGGLGWGGLPAGRRPEELPEIRTQELRRAAGVLGLASATVWDYPDGGVAGCRQDEIVGRIGQVVEELAPDVVVGWGPDGGYGHPDHVAIGACTDAAVARVAPQVPLYHMAVSQRLVADYRAAFALAGVHDELPLRAHEHVSLVFRPSPDELRAKAAAIACHESQLQPWLVTMLGRRDILERYGPEGYIRVGGERRDLELVKGLFPEAES